MNVENSMPAIVSKMVFFQVMPLAVLTDEEAFTEAFGSQSDRKTSLSINSHDVLSVDELLESVRWLF